MGGGWVAVADRETAEQTARPEGPPKDGSPNDR